MKKGILSDEQRDQIIRIVDAGISQTEAAKILGVSLSAVNNTVCVAKAVREEDWERYSTLRDSVASRVTFDWALSKYGKTQPKEEEKPTPEKKERNNNDELFVKLLKEACSEAIEENCKDNKVEQIDKDQMARIMFEIGNINSTLEKIVEKLDDLCMAWS